jgi:hypothetical protein
MRNFLIPGEGKFSTANRMPNAICDKRKKCPKVNAVVVGKFFSHFNVGLEHRPLALRAVGPEGSRHLANSAIE